MIFPRTRRQSARYGRRKVLAAIVTFLVLFTLAKLLGWDVLIRERFRPAAPHLTAARAFRDRLSDVEIQGEGVIEALSPLPTSDGSPASEALVRLLSGHPVRVRVDSTTIPGELGVGDTLRFRGLFRWDNEGGTVDLTEGDATVARLGQLE